MLKDKIINIYKQNVFTRCDDTGSIYYFSHKDFKDLILTWMKGGIGFKSNFSRSLKLTNINWDGFSIEDIKTILRFATGDENGADRAESCEISGIISMGANNLSKEDSFLIDNVFKKTKGIDIIVKYPYPNIFLEIPSSIVAGEEVMLKDEIYSSVDFDYNFVVDYSFVIETDDENAEGSLYDIKTGKRYIKINDTEIRQGTVEITNDNILKTQEIIVGEDSKTMLAVIFTYGGNRKFDLAQLEIKDPTYPKTLNILGEKILNEINTDFRYDLIIESENKEEPIGTYNIEWELSGEGLNYIDSALTEDKKTLIITTEKSLPDEIVLTASTEIKVSVNYNKQYINNDTIENHNIEYKKEIVLLNENIVLAKATNPYIMDIIDNYTEWSIKNL